MTQEMLCVILKREMQTFSGYKLTEALGSGAMETVYRGVHVQTGQEAAVQKLNSPWLMTVLAIGETKEADIPLPCHVLPFLAMVERTASQRLRRQKLVKTLREGNPIPPEYD